MYEYMCINNVLYICYQNGHDMVCIVMYRLFTVDKHRSCEI